MSRLRLLLICLASVGAAAASVSCGGPGNGDTSRTGQGDGGLPGLPGLDDGGGIGTVGDGGCTGQQGGCLCSSPGATVACWTGLPANRGVGACHDGTQTCQTGSGEFPEWGPCIGEVLACANPPDAATPPVSPPTADSCARMALTYIDTQFPATVCLLTPTGGVRCAPTGPYDNGVGTGGAADGGTFPPSLSGVRCISGGEDFFCVVTSVGGVTCWGDGAAFDPVEDQFGAFSGTEETMAIPGLESGVIDIAAGETHTCVLMATGSVSCWGNGAGELNGGTWPLSASPAAVTGLGGAAISIASGDGFSCALRADGAVLCWGNNTGGELGNGTTTGSATPVAVPLPSPAVGLWADQATHPCALLKNGAVWCWGTTTQTGQTLSPVQVTGFAAGITSLTTGGEESMSCALLANTGVQCWGSYGADPLAEDGSLFQILPPGAGAVGLRSIDDDFCVLLSDGGVSCWGSDPGIPDGGGGAACPISGL